MQSKPDRISYNSAYLMPDGQIELEAVPQAAVRVEVYNKRERNNDTVESLGAMIDVTNVLGGVNEKRCKLVR